MVRYTSDEDDDWIYALTWRRFPEPNLYWSVWVGWTLEKARASTFTNDEIMRSAASRDFDDRLPPKHEAEWMPIYRKYPLYAEHVIDVC